MAYFKHAIPEALPLVLIGFIAPNTSVIIIHTKMEQQNGLRELVEQDPTLTAMHRSPLAVAARGASHTSLVELCRKKLASL